MSLGSLADRMRRGFAVPIVMLFAALSAWPVQAETSSVKARDFYFTPDFRVLVTGDSVLWTVEGSAGHTITSYPNAATSFDSSPGTTDTCEPSGGGLLEGEVTPDCLQQGQTWGPETFNTVGTVDYYCKIHGNPSVHPDPSVSAGAQPCGMCGRILVKVPSSARPATRHPTPGPDTSETADPSASPSASASIPGDPSPQPSGSLIAGGGDADGGSGGLRALFATGAIALLTGLGVLVWRRYFVTS